MSITRSLMLALGLAGILFSAAEAQSGTVAGRVVDDQNRPLAGATVAVEGTTIGSISDLGGRFVLVRVPTGALTLRFTYLGYRPESTAVQVQAGANPLGDVRMTVAAIELEGLVVEGQRRGQAQALNQQMTAPNITNVVSEEQIERFPDSNIAAGLQRVPGITISHDYGEPSGVSIRGLGSEMNSITIDGQRIPATGPSGRSTNVGIILSDMVASMEVIKAITPEMDADAIGGTVNLVTRTPDRFILDATAGGGLNELSSKEQVDLALTVGNQVGRFGFLLGGSYLQSGRAEESLHYGWSDDQEMLRSFTLYNYMMDRTRWGTSGRLSYQIGRGSELYARGMFNRYDESQFTPKLAYALSAGSGLSSTGVTGARADRNARERDYIRDIATAAVGGTHSLPSMLVDYGVVYSRGMGDQHSNNSGNFRLTGLDFSIDLEDRTFPRIAATNGIDYANPTLYRLTNFNVLRDKAMDEDVTAEMNVEIPLSAGLARSIKFGGKYRTKSAFRDRLNQAFSPVDASTLTMDRFLKAGFDNPEHFRGRYQFGQQADFDVLRLYVDANPGEFRNSVAREVSNYNASEDVAAGYMMATLETGPLRLLGGMRYEHTGIDHSGLALLRDGAGEYLPPSDISASNSYGGFYPSLHLQYRLDDRTNIRAAATRALARPAYYSLVPYENVDVMNRRISRGNPELDPSNAVNLDLMAERYLPSLGLISGGLFYKSIEDHIISRSFAEEGSLYGYDEFRVTQPQNAASASLWGYEATWQQQFTFLPGLLDGLGLYLNYTYIDSEVELPETSARKVTMPDHVPHTANASLMYEKHGFSGSVAMHYQDRILDGVGDTEAEDEYLGSRNQWDVSLSQVIRDGARVYAEFNNITNEPYFYYLGEQSRVPLERAIYSWWTTVGIKYDF